ncbi:hypothetical protein Vadar_028360 [Vaccinium darrowii]|uniref:Uncharacterized protein n=1 Tax=Vaccinium darrowii TaxID=229202 RepID=A0ACB7ZEY4_9ERIC|nr:hypothetical protein Vadar_028360 [Vaccinium darrowii]
MCYKPSPLGRNGLVYIATVWSYGSGLAVRGYFTWSFLDVFELLDGYNSAFGLYYVDMDDKDLKRYPKLSAHWYANFLKGNNISLDSAIELETVSSPSQSHSSQLNYGHTYLAIDRCIRQNSPCSEQEPPQLDGTIYGSLHMFGKILFIQVKLCLFYKEEKAFF